MERKKDWFVRNTAFRQASKIGTQFRVHGNFLWLAVHPSSRLLRSEGQCARTKINRRPPQLCGITYTQTGVSTQQYHPTPFRVRFVRMIPFRRASVKTARKTSIAKLALAALFP